MPRSPKREKRPDDVIFSGPGARAIRPVNIVPEFKLRHYRISGSP
jgi:hypothetical protein